MVEQADLGIDISNATCEEWIQTAYHDTIHSMPRLRNPVTDKAFDLENLKRIFNYLIHTHEGKVSCRGD